MRKLIIFIPSFRGGGVEAMMVKIANEWIESGHDVTFIVCSDEGPVKGKLSLKARLVVLGRSRVAASVLDLALWLRRCRPDDIFTAMGHCNIAVTIAAVLARYPGRVVLSERNPPSMALLRRNAVRQWVVKGMMRWAITRSAATIAISDGVKRDMLNVYGKVADKVTVIHNPAYDGSAASAAENGDSPFPNHWSGATILVAAGRLHPQKDIDTLLHAVAGLRAEKKRVFLAVLGEGAERPRLESLAGTLGISDIVEFRGFVGNPLEYFRHASLFVLSSAWEGFGNVIVEALSVGLPVVATDCPGGAREILRGGEFGVLVPVRDPNALAEGIKRAVAIRWDRVKLMARAMEFDVKPVAERYLAAAGCHTAPGRIV